MTTKPTELRRRGIGVILDLFPFVWTYKKRVIFAFVSLILAKLAVVATPIYLKDIINELSVPPSAMVFPLAALIGYGFMRIAGSLFQELRDAIFSRVTQGSIKEIAVAVFKHLFGLSMRFHLQRQTGGLSRDIERGTKSIGYMLNFILFRIIPTLLELLMVMGVLLYLYDLWFTVVTLVTIAVYVIFTFAVTERRLVTRRQMNTLDSMANSKAIDALMNYETVKYFDNEGYEINRYQENMQGWVNSSVKNQVSLNFLNSGQSIIITLGTLTLLWMAALRVYAGEMSVGDVVLVSTYLTQLYVPLTMLGFIYREMKNALADIERMFNLFKEQGEVADRPDAIELSTRNPGIEFKNVDFAYEAERQILKNLSFNIEAGKTLAVVGTSGAGKSTLARLLFRFYDVTGGQILIDGVDIRDYTQSSLRRHIGIVPQDTVLFNDTIFYNIAYGNTTASADEVSQAAKDASLEEFILSLPDGYETMVGERGLKLSGGEKQRVAIARTLLKNPPILILDEATSALDTQTERQIQEALARVAEHRTTLMIAHRLSTIVGADNIIVMEHGEIVEQGTHEELLLRQGKYAQMWAAQN